jgi:hypothetical protein
MVTAARLRVRAGWKQTTGNNTKVLCSVNRGNVYTQKSSVVVSEAGVSRMCSGRGSFHRKIQVKSSQASTGGSSTGLTQVRIGRGHLRTVGTNGNAYACFVGPEGLCVFCICAVRSHVCVRLRLRESA